MVPPGGRAGLHQAKSPPGGFAGRAWMVPAGEASGPPAVGYGQPVLKTLMNSRKSKKLMVPMGRARSALASPALKAEV